MRVRIVILAAACLVAFPAHGDPSSRPMYYDWGSADYFKALQEAVDCGKTAAKRLAKGNPVETAQSIAEAAFDSCRDVWLDVYASIKGPRDPARQYVDERRQDEVDDLRKLVMQYRATRQ